MVTLEKVNTYNELRKLLYTHTFYLTEGKLVAVHDKTGVVTAITEIMEDIAYSGVLELCRSAAVNGGGGVDVSLAFKTSVVEPYKVIIPVSNTYHLPVDRMLVEPIEETLTWAVKRQVELGLVRATFLHDLDVVELPPYNPQDPSFTLDTLERDTYLGRLYLTYYRREGVEGIKPVDYFFV